MLRMEPQSALVLIADCTRMQGETMEPGLCDALFWGTSRSYPELCTPRLFRSPQDGKSGGSAAAYAVPQPRLSR